MEYKGYSDVSDIQNINSFPVDIQDHIYQFEDTVSCKLNERRKMNCKPVMIELDPDATPPWKSTKARPTAAHWRSQANDVLDSLIEVG